MIPEPSRAKRIRVLVVDDSAVVRQALSALLTAAGFTVDVAADPIFAQAKMARARPSAIVLDVEMPRMDGLTFLREIHCHQDEGGQFIDAALLIAPKK